MDKNIKNTNEERVGLLQKIYAKLHTVKLSKKIIGLILAGAITISMTGCGTTTNPNGTNGTEPGTSQGQGNEELNKYSQLLQNVLTNKEYNTLIAQAKADSSLYDSGEFQPHPYAFLESQGFNEEQIKNGTTPCYTMSYVLDDEPNNLYMYTRIQPNKTYYTNYLIRYTLTDQEMDEYYMLHYSLGDNSYTHIAIQALFINNEISKMKTPTIIGQSNILINTQTKLGEAADGQKYLHTDEYKCDHHFVALNVDHTNPSFDILIVPKYFYRQNRTTLDLKLIFVHNMKCPRFDEIKTDNGYSHIPSQIMYLSNPDLVETKESTFFFSQDINLEKNIDLNITDKIIP